MLRAGGVRLVPELHLIRGRYDAVRPLYNDYYLDDWLTEAALAETQLFFTDLVQRNGPVRNLISCDYRQQNLLISASAPLSTRSCKASCS